MKWVARAGVAMLWLFPACSDQQQDPAASSGAVVQEARTRGANRSHGSEADSRRNDDGEETRTNKPRRLRELQEEGARKSKNRRLHQRRDRDAHERPHGQEPDEPLPTEPTTPTTPPDGMMGPPSDPGVPSPTTPVPTTPVPTTPVPTTPVPTTPAPTTPAPTTPAPATDPSFPPAPTTPIPSPGPGGGGSSGDPNEVCTDGQINCGYGCVDPDSSQDHCGGCSYYPSSPNYSVDGFQLPEGAGTGGSATDCPSGYQACGAYCLYVLNDVFNCGACGNACAAGEGCSGGACVPLCEEGSSYCNGSCVPGECGQICPYEASCDGGACACNDGLSLCSYEDPYYSYSYCSDLQNDRYNCGGCNIACGLGSECVAGQCEAIDCGPLHQVCGDTCVDTESDQYACGGCTSNYGADYTGDSSACSEGQTYCNGYCVNGDSCGLECPYQASCEQGSCQCGNGQTLCTLEQFGYTYSQCTNVSLDRSNCGACGNDCGVGAQCVSGSCQAIACPGDQILCGDTCVDPLADPYSCGGCTVYSSYGPIFPGPFPVGPVFSSDGVSAPGASPVGAATVAATTPPVIAPATTSGTLVGSIDPIAIAPTAPTPIAIGGVTTPAVPALPPAATTPVPVPTSAPTAPSPDPGVPTIPGQEYHPPLVCGADGVTGDPACCPYYQPDSCNGGCTELDYDAQNCGACGNTCDSDEYCQQGSCQPVCSDGTIFCDGYCIAGDSCGQVCLNGSCEQGSCACADGQSACDSSYGPYIECFDLQSDRYNCGGCGIACNLGSECASGSCEPIDCGPILTLCGNSCVDTQSDLYACGGCTPSYEAIYTGDPAGCGAGQTFCDGYCVNGGTCGETCPQEGSCEQGTCTCPEGLGLCNYDYDFYSFSYCANFESDSSNCGGCSSYCDLGTQCSAGSCEPIVCDAPTTLCGSSCVDTQTDFYSCGGCSPNYGAIYTGDPSGCAAGQTYCDGYCVNGDSCGEMCPYGGSCEDGACSCPDGLTLCSFGEPEFFYSYSFCADTGNDRNNCGGCGIACELGTDCISGSCEAITCDPGTTLCGNSCVDTESDVYACGGCTTNYEAAYTGNPNDCGPGQSYCGGYCVNGDSCGETCAYNGVCEQGVCGCEDGSTLCSYGPYDSYCANFDDDRYNCGGCGINCALGSGCVAGACEPIECGDLFTLCGNDCVDTSTDIYACGGCTTNYEAVYTGNPARCGAGQSYCDGYCVNGDSCGSTCGNGICDAGSCTCAAGLSACSYGSSYTYCADFDTDRYNCGECDNYCNFGTQCVAGSCQACDGPCPDDFFEPDQPGVAPPIAVPGPPTAIPAPPPVATVPATVGPVLGSTAAAPNPVNPG